MLSKTIQLTQEPNTWSYHRINKIHSDLSKLTGVNVEFFFVVEIFEFGSWAVQLLKVAR